MGDIDRSRIVYDFQKPGRGQYADPGLLAPSTTCATNGHETSSL